MRFRKFVAFVIIMIAHVTVVDATRIDADSADAREVWRDYKQTFIQADGRVIDRQQQDISHSEGQGFGMLNSVIYDDQQTFDSVWRWTQSNLRARTDGLLPWSWGRRQNGQWGVIDYNNATDGDLLVAFALLKASEKWKKREYKKQGLHLIRAMRRELTTTFQNQTFLMPAYFGFHSEDSLVLNPSYVILSAYRSFAEVDDSEYWQKLYRDGLSLIHLSSFGSVGLPSDWVVLGNSGVNAWNGKPNVFGYDAIRTILYLSWEEDPKFPIGVDKLFTFYEEFDYLPAEIVLNSSLESDLKSLEEAPAGFYAVFACAAQKITRVKLAERLWKKAFERSKSEKNNYYSMSLLLLALSNGDL